MPRKKERFLQPFSHSLRIFVKLDELEKYQRMTALDREIHKVQGGSIT